jgi:hypothetical protein
MSDNFIENGAVLCLAENALLAEARKVCRYLFERAGTS